MGSQVKILQTDIQAYVKNIAKSGLTIYDKIEIGHPDLWIPSLTLEILLNEGLKGLNLANLPLRTRSKVVKEAVCRVLGYPVPISFKKTKPRFPGQQFDTYIQKSNNLQIWNEEISSFRRYAVIRVSAQQLIECVRVIPGEILALFDRTGTLTQKYQARLIASEQALELVTPEDTSNLTRFLQTDRFPNFFKNSPLDNPIPERLMSIKEVFQRLKRLVGQSFINLGADQERNRGGQLHHLVCKELGYENYADDGRFPDIRDQLLEVKLQMSPTIDLGLILPSSEGALDMPAILGSQIRHCDVRFAIFAAESDGQVIKLSRLYLSTGEKFFTRFPQFQGKVINKKLQIPLPASFFDQ